MEPQQHHPHNGHARVSTAALPPSRSSEPIHLRSAIHRADQGSSFPAPLTPLVGREREVAAIHNLLRQTPVRLVTLTGPGGVGKTRLALHIAEVAVGDFPDGVWFVPLASIRDPVLVADAIAQAVGVREAGHRSLVEGIAALIRGKHALIVLDNFEHVIEAAPLIAQILVACPGLAFLVTSRSPLHVSGEHAFPVPPLPLPPAARSTTAERAALSPAVRLFVGCAQVSGSAFALSDDNAEDVVAICQALDGLPLATELAATRVRHLTLADLRSRLGGATDHTSLKLLTGGRRDTPERHRTIRDTVAWSYTLLGESEQRLFRHLAVFTGGFDLEAAEAVCASVGIPISDVLNCLAILIDHSLVHQVPGLAGETRFDMLETIRHYGIEVLAAAGEEQTVRDAHAAYFLAFAEGAAPDLFRETQRAWLDRLGIEHANVRAALARLYATEDHDALMRLSVALLFFWWFQGHLAEGSGWLERVLAGAADGHYPARCWSVFGAALLANNLGDLDRGASLAREARALAIAGELPVVEGMALVLSAYVALARGQMDVAVALGESAISLLRSAGDDVFLANALGDVGLYLAAAGQIERGSALIEEALQLDRARGDRFLAGVRLSDRGVIAHDTGDYATAVQCYSESVGLLAEVGGRWYLASPCAGLAALSVTRDPARAARLLGAAAALRERSGIASWPTEQERDEHATTVARAILGPEDFASEVDRGRALSWPETVAEALAAADSERSVTVPSVGFSPREQDVLRLLVAGRSDREIAETLFISPRTASKHVGAILAKLGVASRGEAAVRAVRDGLV